MRSEPLPAPVTLRLLGGGRAEMTELQRVLEGAPDYARRVTGLPPGPDDARSTRSMLPPGKGDEDKFVYGVFLGGAMVGCADVVRGWPDAGTAMIGLLLVDEAHQGQGIGGRALSALEREIGGWAGCRRIRIAVVLTNAEVIPFWERMGFAATGERKPYRHGSVESEAVILEKAIGPKEAGPAGG